MDTGSPCFQDIPLSTEINTSCASALSPISHFFFFTPRWRTLLQCNVVRKIEWTTFPGRLIISWILSACSLWWGLTEGLTGENDVLFSAGITVQVPLRRLQLRYEVYINHRFFGSSRVHEGRENSQSKGNEWHRGANGAAERPSSTTCVHVWALSLSQHIQIEKALTSKHLQIQDTLEMKYRKLLHNLNL